MSGNRIQQESASETVATERTGTAPQPNTADAERSSHGLYTNRV